MPEPITITDQGTPSLSEDNQAALEELKQAEADLEKENAIAQEEQLIGGEFQSQEDLLAAYQELKANQEQYRPPGEPQTAQEIYGEAVGNRLEEAGVDYSKMNDYWQENGEITDKHYKELEKAGFPRGIVDAHLDGLRNRLFASNVHVLTVKPGFVYTKMTHHLNLPKLLTANPSKVAQDIVKAQQKKKNILYTLWFWKLIMLIIKNIPEQIFKKMKL